MGGLDLSIHPGGAAALPARGFALGARFPHLPPQLLCMQLIDKSADLSMASQMFYKQARKANSCCSFM